MPIGGYYEGAGPKDCSSEAFPQQGDVVARSIPGRPIQDRDSCASPRRDSVGVVSDVMEDREADALLMASFGRKEIRAAEELYGRFASRILGLGQVMLGNSAEAQDLVQDTFVKLARTADRFDARIGGLDTWVLLTARNLAIDAIRRRVVEARVLHGLVPAYEASDDPSPEQIAETGDLIGRAREAMRRLSPEQRAALELSYLGGKTGREVAEIEGIPLGTAKTRIRGALLRLRAEMEVHRDL